MNRSPYDAPHSQVHDGDLHDGQRHDPAALTADDRQWGMLAHLSILTFLVSGIGIVLGPLIVWLMKRDQSPFIAAAGREALNFGINVIIWGVVAFLLFVTIILIPVAIVIWLAVGVAALVLPIMAALQANGGNPFRYPAIYRLVK